MNDPQLKPIFFDETRRRSGLFTFLLYLLTASCVIGAVIFLVTIIISPHLPAIVLTRSGTQRTEARTSLAAAKSPGDPTAHARNLYVLHQNRALQEAKRKLAAAITREKNAAPIPAAAIAPGHVAGPVRAAYYVNDDKPSLDSVEQHIGQITHLMPVWMDLSPNGSKAVSIQDLSANKPGGVDAETSSDTNDDIVLRLAHSHGVAILPTVQNFNPKTDEFDHKMLANLVNDKKNRQAVIGQLRDFVTQGRYQGINIDFEDDSADSREGMTAFMSELSSVFHPLGLLVTQDIQLDSDMYDLPTLARLNDFLVPMLYDEHANGTTPGPVASQSWYEQELATFMHTVPASKAVLGLANYGYDWTQNNVNAQDVSFETAAQTAQESQDTGDDQDGIIKIDPKSLNPYFTYNEDATGPDGQEISHTVWLQDAITAYNQIRAAQPYHPLGLALWRLGSEDPSLWTFFGKDSAAALTHFDTRALASITYNSFGTFFEGRGDVLDVVRPATTGQRTVTSDPKTGYLTGEHFLHYPSQYVIRRRGLVGQQDGENAGKNTTRSIALTFDDGPDPRWTPQILDILHHYHVPACFFVVGENAESHPGLVTREWNMGMEIGNHSYTHPEMEHVTPLRTKLELDATQRVIEALTGHMTTLFRAPNRADSEPTTLADFEPILDADRLGYLFIGEQIDPTDWRPGITAPEIVSKVLAQAQDGNCVLLHDAGGTTRAETVKALPQIIEGLQKRGYHFVTVSQLVGRPKSEVFPEVTGQQRLTVAFDRAFFDITHWTGQVFGTLFLLGIFLGISRILVMGGLASVQSKREAQRTYDPTYKPTVSVVIAAYNEAKVINQTIATLLVSDYPDLEIVVVDDGSRDGTAETVRRAYGMDSRVTVMTKPNGGKASALNLGIKECRGEIVVALDADTVFAPDTVSRLVRHFADPNLGAVSGNVKVGNRRNPLTLWQAVEYITSQNFDRRAFDLLNCITVVPGAVGAWRKDAVVLAGMYSSQTLAEDTDLTFKIRKLGYRITTDNTALAYTEAPDTLRNLAKQRFRWAFGTLQCLWKHRDALLNPRYGTFGLVALPSLWIFQIGFQALAPLVDLTIAWSVFYSLVIMPTFVHNDIVMLLGYWALFSTVELAGAAIAFHLDKEDKSLLGWLLVQRFVYRQLMYGVIVSSLFAAVRGSLVGWGKFERKGTVRQPTAPLTTPRPPSETEGPDLALPR